ATDRVGRCAMLRSEGRILTTHAGSLPRSNELVERYVRHSNGEAVDAAELDAAIADSTRRVVQRQLEVGIDVGCDGEQARESFFTYVRSRMTGFGGRGERPPFKDRAAFPSYARSYLGGYTARPRINLLHPPKA